MRRTPGTTPEAARVGYEINFNRHFYRPQPMRSLDEIRADILALEQETEDCWRGSWELLSKVQNQAIILTSTKRSYKSAGTHWITTIPTDWRMQRVKSLLGERNERGHPSEPLLAATQSQGVVLKREIRQPHCLAVQ